MANGVNEARLKFIVARYAEPALNSGMQPDHIFFGVHDE